MFRAFYSDPHFGHKNIIEYAERPFSGLGEMHEALIERYNSIVGPNDWVLWCGDCFMLPENECRSILKRMNGLKALVIGNHDKSKHFMAGLGFVFVVDTLQMRIGEKKVIVSHYPYANTDRRNGMVDERYLDRRPVRLKDQILIHGHTHSRERRNGSMIHVGVDAWDCGPAPIEAVEALVAEVC